MLEFVGGVAGDERRKRKDRDLTSISFGLFWYFDTAEADIEG